MLYDKHLTIRDKYSKCESEPSVELFNELQSLAEGLEIDYENGYNDLPRFMVNERKYFAGCKILKSLYKYEF